MVTQNELSKNLLQSIRKGDERAFQSLFLQYRENLLFYIAGITRSREAAEELVIDVFLKIWDHPELIDGIENFDAWLFRVAYNKSIDFLRNASRQPREDAFLGYTAQLGGNLRPDLQILDREYESKLREAILQLSPQRRLVYLLSREKGFSHNDIARELHLSKHTVSNHIVESQRFIKAYIFKHLGISA